MDADNRASFYRVILSSGGRREVADEHLRLRTASLGGDLEHLLGDVLSDVGLAAVLADLGRNLVDDDRLSVAMEGDRGRARSSLSMMSNDAVHRPFLRVLKSDSQSTGSGW